jgi:ubiquinone/menaquinone biosynthesis C-methylase UbiE
MNPSIHDRLALLTVRFAKRKKPKLQPTNSAEFYQEFFADEHLSQYEEDLRSVLRHEEIRRVVDSLPVGMRALDLGCGVGHILSILPSGFKKVGVDYSLSSLKLARRHLPEPDSLVNASGQLLPFDDSTFDLVTCLEVLEHLEDDEKAVSEISRVLKPGGYLIASVPNQYYFEEYRELMGHYRHYTPASFAELLARYRIQIKTYLNEYKRFNFLYFYAYVTLEGVNLVLNKVMRTSTSLYARKIPFLNIKLYKGIVAPIFRQVKKLDEGGRSPQSSTFVMAQLVK